MKENIEYLQMLGLTEYQSRILVVLFAKEKATALQISKLGSVPLTKIYQVLKELEYMDMISHSPGKPRIYSCPGAETVLNDLIQKKVSKVEELRGMKEEQIEVVTNMELTVQTENKKVHPVFSEGQYNIRGQR
ncbi:MAG: helix-turn-helix domain-containing protein [Candidatus Undinarchaeales archaeon]